MPPFRFRAAAALDLRRKQEDAAAAALAAAEARFREISQQIEAIEQQRRAAQLAERAHVGRGIDAANLFWHRNWITRLRSTADDLGIELRQQSAAVTAAREAWQQARRRRLALERLYERALKRYRAEAQRQELKALDELARIRFVMPDAGGKDLFDGD